MGRIWLLWALQGGDQGRKRLGRRSHVGTNKLTGSTVLRDARERYPMQQKLLFSLLSASRKLRHYFQGHPIKVVTSYPLEQVLRNPNATDRR